jgi:hypothetical protein
LRILQTSLRFPFFSNSSKFWGHKTFSWKRKSRQRRLPSFIQDAHTFATPKRVYNSLTPPKIKAAPTKLHSVEPQDPRNLGVSAAPNLPNRHRAQHTFELLHQLHVPFLRPRIAQVEPPLDSNALSNHRHMLATRGLAYILRLVGYSRKILTNLGSDSQSGMYVQVVYHKSLGACLIYDTLLG